MKLRYSFLFFLSSFILISFPISGSAEILNCTNVTYTSPSNDKNNITFTFDKSYQCGQFANGDWWVSVGSSKYVKILSITPKAINNINGLEINPSKNRIQGFDYRINGYKASLNHQLPISIKEDSSIVKTVSVTTKKKCFPCLQFAAVLSIVKSPIQNSKDIFRPGYYGNKKKYYSFSDKMIKKLPKYSRKYLSSAKEWPFNRIVKRYVGVQLDHILGWSSRSMHPIDNMSDYGAEIAVDNAVAILRMMLDDFDIKNDKHKLALVSYLQMSIDFQSMADNGVIWPEDGGHGNGRKLPLLFAGYMLNDLSFYRSIAKSYFSEDHQIYKSRNNGKALFGMKCTTSAYWEAILYNKGRKDCRDPYEFIDGGNNVGGSYQHCCTAKPWKYTALAVSLLGLKSEWKNDTFFEYVERWVKHGAWTKPDPCAKYNGLPKDFNKKYGGRNSCILGDGRFIGLHGKSKDGGHYESKFGDKMWLYYK